MAATLSFLRNKRAAGGNIVTKVFKCVLNGNYTNSGGVGNVGTPGETLNFNAASNAKYAARPKLPSAPAGKLPANTDFRVFLPNGYEGQVEQNANNPTTANFVLRIFTSGGNELAAGAYPAGLTQAGGFVIEADVPLKYA